MIATLLPPDLLRTERLILRAPRHTDAAAIFATYTQDIDVARFMVWRPHTTASETEGFISYCIEQWASGRGRPYVLALDGSEHIAIGMLDARILSHTIDLGYVLGRQYWGAGLMPEAVMALSDAALALPSCFRVQATCDVENQASSRTLVKAGFAYEGQLARHIILPNLGAEPRASLMYARCR